MYKKFTFSLFLVNFIHSKSSFDQTNTSFFDVFVKGKLGPYLAGLIEGDGHIYVPSVMKKEILKGKKIFLI